MKNTTRPTSSRTACAIRRAIWRWRAHDLNVPVVLGSATPSLETWQHAERGRYLRLALPRARQQPAGDQAGGHAPPADEAGLSPQLLDAIGQRLERKEQSLIFLNRRGYAPVLHCQSCAWVSNCPRCTAFTVLHRSGNGGNRLHCHHCGYQATVPRACPECGDQDLAPMGRGTQRIEEHLAELFRGAHPAHRRRQHAQERQRRSAVRVGARGRGRHPGGHADGGQGPRLRAPGAGGCAQRRFHAVRA